MSTKEIRSILRALTSYNIWWEYALNSDSQRIAVAIDDRVRFISMGTAKALVNTLDQYYWWGRKTA